MEEKKKSKKTLIIVLVIILVLLLVVGGIILGIYLVDKNSRQDIRNKAKELVNKYEKEYNGTNYIEFENGFIELNNDGKVTFLKIKDKDYCYTRVDSEESVIKGSCDIQKTKIIVTEHECLSTECEVGTELDVMVNETGKYTFNVLSDKDGYLTLIMKDSLGYKTNYNDALKYLNELTTNWTYINRINEYEYKNDGISYSTLNINNGVVKVDENIIDGVAKARLITEEELKELGCTSKIGSCPEWLYSGLSSSNTNKNPYGSWTLSTSNTIADYVFTLFYTGNINTNISSNESSYGVRPIITIKK